MNAGAADVDNALVVRAQQGDREAVEVLLRHHYETVHAVCHRMVSSRDGADDAVQNALIAIARGLPRFDGRSRLSTWIYRIATNAALDEIRRARRAPRPADPVELTSRESVNPRSDAASELVDHLDRVRTISDALTQVPEDFRGALVLRYILDLDYAEIAEVLGVPVGTVRSRLARGKQFLAERLVAGPNEPAVTGNTARERPNLEPTNPRESHDGSHHR